ncbi:hypothetical protein [Pyruvatibacter mobilis]|uniref:hypothetical protein n=1 Tax=Pyruvatibacter mobilis TaxID=1712261 RepID=UPI003BB14517
MATVETFIANDLDQYEELIAEIQIDGKCVAVISQEDGFDKLRLEFPETRGKSAEMITRNVGLEDFLRGVDIATKRLRGELP